MNEINLSDMNWCKQKIDELQAVVAQQAAVIEQMREALQLCRSHMYCHASNTGDNAFDKLCSALTHQPCPEVLNKVQADAKRYRFAKEVGHA